MTSYHSLGEILLDLSKVEQYRAAGQRVEAVKLWAKPHLDDDAGRIEAACKARYGAFTVETANRLCGEVCCHNDLSDYEAKRLPPSEFLRHVRELPALVVATQIAAEAVAPELFIPTPLQGAILDALDGSALKQQPLAEIVSKGDTKRLYKPGGLTELRERGMVAHKRGVGFYRPGAPPPSSLLSP